jgi:hypothetical protein
MIFFGFVLENHNFVIQNWNSVSFTLLDSLRLGLFVGENSSYLENIYGVRKMVCMKSIFAGFLESHHHANKHPFL